MHWIVLTPKAGMHPSKIPKGAGRTGNTPVGPVCSILSDLALDAVGSVTEHEQEVSFGTETSGHVCAPDACGLQGAVSAAAGDVVAPHVVRAWDTGGRANPQCEMPVLAGYAPVPDLICARLAWDAGVPPVERVGSRRASAA